jgi:hypothetical protein
MDLSYSYDELKKLDQRLLATTIPSGFPAITAQSAGTKQEKEKEETLN